MSKDPFDLLVEKLREQELQSDDDDLSVNFFAVMRRVRSLPQKFDWWQAVRAELRLVQGFAAAAACAALLMIIAGGRDRLFDDSDAFEKTISPSVFTTEEDTGSELLSLGDLL